MQSTETKDRNAQCEAATVFRRDHDDVKLCYCLYCLHSKTANNVYFHATSFNLTLLISLTWSIKCQKNPFKFTSAAAPWNLLLLAFWDLKWGLPLSSCVLLPPGGDSVLFHQHFVYHQQPFKIGGLMCFMFIITVKTQDRNVFWKLWST